MPWEMETNIPKWANLLIALLVTGLVTSFAIALATTGTSQSKKVEIEVYDPEPDIALLKERVLLLEAKFQFSTEGVASWYGDREHGRKTASGEVFDRNGYTAASRLLPLGCFVIVENIANKRKVVVKVNDRGPYIDGRLIDLSEAAAKVLDFHSKGLEKVRVTPIHFGD